MALRDQKPNVFYTVTELEVEVPQTDVIAIVNDVKTATIKKATAVSDSNDVSYDSHDKVSVTMKSYKITKTIASNFVPDENDAEDDDEEEEEESKSKSKSRSTSKARKSKKVIKKITGVKKGAKSKSKGKRTKKGADKATPAQAKTKKTKAGKVKVEKYKKGKWNPFVTVREKMDQAENSSQVPNLDQSVRNNNRELIRAAIIGSQKLYKAVAYSKQ